MLKYLLVLSTFAMLSCTTVKFAALDLSKSDSPTPYSPILRLNQNKEFSCTAVVIGKNYALTAGHCIVNDEYTKLVKNLTVTSQDGSKTINVKAEKVNNIVDIGLISGDFSEFEALKVRNEDLGVGVTTVTCGFAGGNKLLSCMQIKPQSNDNFHIKADGYLVGGQSGGPVYNPETHTLVGINTNVYPLVEGGGMGYAPVMGSLGFFGIEP